MAAISSHYNSSIFNIVTDLMAVVEDHDAVGLERYATDSFASNCLCFDSISIFRPALDQCVQADINTDITNNNRQTKITISETDISSVTHSSSTISLYYKCEWCGIQLVDFNRLTTHRSVEKGVHECCICLKKLSSKSVRGHKKRMHKQKECVVCNGSFSTDSDLHAHFINPRKEGDLYTCCLCGILLHDLEYLFNHIRDEHKKVGQLWYPDAFQDIAGLYKCKFCPDFTSAKISACNAHCTSTTEKVGAIHCCKISCPASFPSVNHFIRHHLKHPKIFVNKPSTRSSTGRQTILKLGN